MKTLLLMRHAKSDWNAPFGHDRERPLNERGVRSARLMGRILADADELPDSVVASSAVRAETTVRLAADEGAWPTPIRVTDLLYNTRPEEVLAEVAAEPDTTARLMIVGHEPTWSALLSELVGGGRHPFPTAAIARVDLPTDSWSLLQPGSGELRWILPPRLAAAVIGE